MIEDDNKNVICCGLDGTFERKPFKTLDLIPYCDELIKLYSKCNYCSNKALFSKRLIKNDSKILVGSNGVYAAVCRKHYKD